MKATMVSPRMRFEGLRTRFESEDETALLVGSMRVDCVGRRDGACFGRKEGKKQKDGAYYVKEGTGRTKRDLYWTRVRAHDFYREMVRMGFVFKERPNEAIDVPVENEKSPSSEPRGPPCDS
ncbi:hypothetical protein Tco_1191699 [Tanacetum coccineum]